ncbi:serine hydrolase domain-containing protein [Marivirga arenosa]|uniref:Serine hydrolase domain-containing protein n=1 Tax=Marivirga arenosa TaxID=3059076 RepID=A0AA49GCW6_9BACT|nr:serine hydrolase domain-containing protein [Marivirga sp. BKB1-2]WKK80697.2 serine hydrolase domain-containing protein [Marivirga sp. BKB1-2]
MKTAFTIISLLLFVNTFTYAQRTTQRIDSLVNSFHESNPEISMSVGFIQGGETFFTAYGNLSREGNDAIDKHTLFEIASITKIMTANLIAQAVLESKLKVDDYIDDYLPAVYQLNKTIQNKIKISDLASHQSGLPDIDFRELIEKNPQQPTASVDQDLLTKLINQCNSLKDYGSYRYSTVGFVLLGQILEDLYGKSYDQLVREKIIAPLNMTRTYTTDFDVANVAIGYNKDGGVQAPFIWNIVAPSGLVKSSTSDMMKFLSALLDETSAIGQAAKLTEVPYFIEGNEAIGLGTNIIQDGDNTLYLKSGDLLGQSSMLCYNRLSDWGVLIFMNQNDWKLRNDMLNTMYESILKDQ